MWAGTEAYAPWQSLASLSARLRLAFFKKLYIDDDTHIHSELAEPFDILLGDRFRRAAKAVAEADQSSRQPDWSTWETSWNESDPEDESLEVAGLKEQVLVGRTCQCA